MTSIEESRITIAIWHVWRQAGQEASSDKLFELVSQRFPALPLEVFHVEDRLRRFATLEAGMQLEPLKRTWTGDFVIVGHGKEINVRDPSSRRLHLHSPKAFR